MSPDDDFPPTQAAPPPPPEPPARPARREGRAATHTADVYAGIEQTLPPRTWKENPLIWIALVVAMFMAVPLLASLSTRGKTPAAPKAQAAAESPASDAAPVPAVPAPAPTVTEATATPAPANVNQLPPNLRPQPDASRQVITKCYENGRVVYTQTGACTGSMSAVPIDTGKNVVGPGGSAPPGGATR